MSVPAATLISAARQTQFGREQTTHEWQARMAITFVEKAGRTVLGQHAFYGPLRIQKPFYPEGDGVCHLYILHPPGGLAGGDDLGIEVQVEARAQALITTPAAGKFYRSNGAVATQRQVLSVAEDACLEWLPQENILFGGSRARLATQIQMHPKARFIGWEITALGRPLSGDHYRSGDLDQRLELFVAGQPMLLERQRLAAGERVIAAPWGLDDHCVFATLVAYPAELDLCDTVRQRIANTPAAVIGVTLVDRTLIVRVLAGEVERGRGALECALQIMRPVITGRPYHRPRIWCT